VKAKGNYSQENVGHRFSQMKHRLCRAKNAKESTANQVEDVNAIPKARRAGIFVARPNKTKKAPSGATSSGERTEYAAPMGLEFLGYCVSTKMPRLRRLPRIQSNGFGAFVLPVEN
jgi:hypothetical protein